MTRPSVIVVGYDFSSHAELALRRAIDLVVASPHQTLHVIAVLDPHVGLPIERTTQVDAAYVERVQDLVADHVRAALGERAAGGTCELVVHARTGEPAAEILGLAGEVGADLVAVGSHALTGIERMLLGSVSAHVVRDAKCAVMVIRPKLYPEVVLAPGMTCTEPRKSYKPLRLGYNHRSALFRPDEWPLP